MSTFYFVVNLLKLTNSLSGSLQIATCSDDNTLKVWRLNRDLEEKSGGDKLSIVGWASQKKREVKADLGKDSMHFSKFFYVFIGLVLQYKMMSQI